MTGGEPPKLTVADVQIHTATVSVQTLMLRDRQMTIAVYRQITSNERWFHGHLMDLVSGWGWVNYHDKSCGKLGYGHRHVIWVDPSGTVRKDVFDLVALLGEADATLSITERERVEWKCQIMKAWQTVTALPQLFIAG